METVLAYLPTFLAILVVCLVLVKVTLFFSFKTKNWKMLNLFYFDITHITLSNLPNELP